MEHFIDKIADLAEILKFIKDYSLEVPTIVASVFLLLSVLLLPWVQWAATFLALHWLFDVAGVAGTPLAISFYVLLGTFATFALKIPQAVLGWCGRRLKPRQKAN